MNAPLELPLEKDTNRVLWTREGVALLVASGLLDGPQYELLEGEIVRKVKNRPHIIALKRLLATLYRVLDEANIQFESPIDVLDEDNKTSSPEPDVAVLNSSVEGFFNTNPGPENIALLVEIADSTRGRDLGQKAKLYARAGIPHYWVLDLNRRSLHLHSLPDGEEWRERRTLTENETVTGYDFTVSVLLPPENPA
jgi:Uma2 family endonuclease